MNHATRRFRRVPIAREAALEIAGVPVADSRRIPVMIRSITCEGAGIALARAPSWLRRGTEVELQFRLEGDDVTVPGQVAWHDPGAAERAPFQAGLQLRLQSARTDHSRRYADWIVDLISRVTQQEMELGAILVRVAGLPLATLQSAIDQQKLTGQGLTDVLLAMQAVSNYDLRLAKRCRLPHHDPIVPTGLLEWRAQLLGQRSSVSG